ncbi:hypothetical protein CRG98_046193 [Punica granatum]|uniref:Uncharacterized protein n=1 Tax=Punica granatum TaxID=22663 RepID=A0A2I0HNY0_PUNGR|nr:hypothetical protein CRG98_046193 [Punica granatum]
MREHTYQDCAPSTPLSPGVCFYHKAPVLGRSPPTCRALAARLTCKGRGWGWGARDWLARPREELRGCTWQHLKAAV